MGVMDKLDRLMTKYFYLDDVDRRTKEVNELLAEGKEREGHAFERVAGATEGEDSREAKRRAEQAKREAERLRRAADDMAIDVLRGDR